MTVSDYLTPTAVAVLERMPCPTPVATWEEQAGRWRGEIVCGEERPAYRPYPVRLRTDPVFLSSEGALWFMRRVLECPPPSCALSRSEVPS